MKFFYYAATAALALVSSPALAQEAPAFGGLYVGAFAGYDHFTLSDGTDSGSKDGVAFGAIVGYDIDLGNVVAGVEGEWGDASTQQTVTDLVATGDSATLAANRDLYVGGRFGFKATPNVLVYAKGGYTDTRLKAAYTDSTGTVSESDNVNGYRVGGGVEYSMGRIGIRGEYRFSDYGEYKYNGVNTGISARRHQVVASLVGKF